MFKKILVATDGSDRADAAVEYALQLAKDARAEVVGLYVVDLTSLPPAGEVTVPPKPSHRGVRGPEAPRGGGERG
ncbi:MAG: universal stress protein [Candidatus Hydrothermarchaeota archaeon]